MKAVINYENEGEKFKTEIYDASNILNAYSLFYQFHHQTCFILSIELIK